MPVHSVHVHCGLCALCILHCALCALCIVHCVHWMQPAFSAAPSPQAPLVPYQMHIYLM